MFALTMLEKIKEVRLRFSHRTVTLLWNKVNYHKKRVKLTNTQLNKLKSAAKNKKGAILRLNMNNIIS